MRPHKAISHAPPAKDEGSTRRRNPPPSRGSGAGTELSGRPLLDRARRAVPAVTAEDIDAVGDDDARPGSLWQRALTLGGLVTVSALTVLLVAGMISFFTAGQFPAADRVPTDGLVLQPAEGSDLPDREQAGTGVEEAPIGGRPVPPSAEEPVLQPATPVPWRPAPSPPTG